MGSPLKNLYSLPFYDRLANTLSRTVPTFDKQKFISGIFTKDFENKELKERMKHTSAVLHSFLPDYYPDAVNLIEVIINRLREDGFGESLEMMFFPDYIETYGLDDYENSVKALEFITQFVSCEFAVRPFILKYGIRMISQMQVWSLHKSHKVRRLASEGSRPRLPWAMAIPELKKNPAPILPILENLKSDPSESVRRSVANSINDIAKDHPMIVIEIAAKWKGISKETDAIIKHGSRTLLKQGHADILKHYGLQSDNLLVTGFIILTPEVSIGRSLEFSFTVKNNQDEKQVVRLEYAVYYQKANGLLAKKVFKISERIFSPQEFCTINRKQSFRLITTRTFYPGQHQLSIIVNGEEKTIDNFSLK
ncbi:DNA alkylation repair protein [Dyadobacter sp. NIV53]|uniref:DNA alkylation repair protein n=1 Tax=Dyadobacter sp. NIV53 TaxID=2861765 RepID=UPI001C8706CE|nr:DNA alkylation repair protein [Dyadobacter sp. NIV53]